MSLEESYRDETFVVANADSRIRQAGDLMEYEIIDGAPRRIPQGTHVRVAEVKVIPTGTRSRHIFALAQADNGSELGWTSTRNFQRQFVNETLGSIAPPPNASRFGPNAAWENGRYVGQKTLVSIVDVKLEIEYIALETLMSYAQLVEAAREAGIEIAINSAFRSYPEQKILFDGWQRRLPGYNQAAPPGTSKHQNGLAFDIPVSGSAGHPVYDWLTRNAPAHGFVRTVTGEKWHWEYAPTKAQAALRAHTYKTPNVRD